MDGYEAETQWVTCMNDAETSPVAERPERNEEVLSECYQASAEVVLRWERSDRVVSGLHEIHEVAGRRQSAKQVLTASILTTGHSRHLCHLTEVFAGRAELLEGAPRFNASLLEEKEPVAVPHRTQAVSNCDKCPVVF